MDRGDGTNLSSSDERSFTTITEIAGYILASLLIIIFIFWFIHFETGRVADGAAASSSATSSSSSASVTSAMGIDEDVLATVPVFVYSPETSHRSPLECAVCLGEFKEKEKGRLLPLCRHSFHVECIDLWFASHSTCPSCRSAVVNEHMISSL